MTIRHNQFWCVLVIDFFLLRYGQYVVHSWPRQSFSLLRSFHSASAYCLRNLRIPHKSPLRGCRILKNIKTKTPKKCSETSNFAITNLIKLPICSYCTQIRLAFVLIFLMISSLHFGLRNSLIDRI